MSIQFAALSQQKDSLVFNKNPILTNRYVGSVGFFNISKSIRMNVDGSMPNRPIDFGESLGLKKEESTFGFNFSWRFSRNKKWSVRLEYSSESNTQSAILEDDIHWGETMYPAGVQLDSGFGFKVFGAIISRVISMGDKHELIGGLGLHTMNIETFVQAKVYIGDDAVDLDTGRKKISVIAPIPSIGLRYLYAPHVRWNLSARVDWFSISLNDYSGTLWNLMPVASFQVSDNFGVGVGYKYFHTKFKFEQNFWRGRGNLLYQGPLISIRGNF